VTNVFPIALNRLALENNQPYWYKPVPLQNPYADNGAIPSLNTTNTNSPRFRAYSTYNNGGQYLWARWNGDEASGSTADLNAALTGAGTLGQGFSEFPPPASDPAAIPLVNGALEAGDWLAGTSATAANADGMAALDWHIANKTLMILPVYDQFTGNGNWPDSGYHIVRFVQVRLLGYSFGGSNKYFEFALVQDNKTCAAALKLSEKLEWFAPVGAASNYDVVIVQDYTYSMQYCWGTITICATGSRRIDYAAADLRRLVNEILVVGNQQQGDDHRLAYVTFNQKATKVIPFSNDTNVTLANFKNAIGDLSSPRTIAPSQLTGNTNTADGLASAVAYLNGGRTVDRYGQPVKLVVVLVTDGLAHVFNDGPATWVSNRWNNAPYYCGDSDADMDNPLVQSNCPQQADYPGQTISTPPLQKMVQVANDASSSKGVEFYALALGNQFGLTTTDMRLNEVAPSFNYLAGSPSELTGLMYSISQDITQPPCAEFSATRNAAGANVSIRDGDGRIVGQGASDSDGIFRTNLALNSGPYTVEAYHNSVVAPADPSQIQRNYRTTFTIPIVDPAQPISTGTLTNVNPSNAQCP
jgi:hypothetical protein